jgi:hypothetical protein
MNSQVQVFSIPAGLKFLEEPSSLLPGESRHEFEVLRQMIIEDVGPKTNLEWLWTIDLVEMSWEILRYRRLRERILQVYRAKAIASILQRLDGAGLPPQTKHIVQCYSEQAAFEWRRDPEAAGEIDARLQKNGFDLATINAEVFLQAREAFAWFDTMMQAAQSRRIALLREIAVRREFDKRSRNPCNRSRANRNSRLTRLVPRGHRHVE